jgi:transposase
MIFAGSDCHVRNSFYHITDGGGQLLCRRRCANTREELIELLADFEGESLRICLESTTNSRAMQRMLIASGRSMGVDMQVDVLDARKLRVIAESVAKCDKLDAKVINELSRSNLDLPTCYMPDDEEFALREHLRARSDLVRIRTMLKNRVHAVLHRRGILLPPRMALFTAAGRVFLDQVELDEAGRTILTRYLQQVDEFKAVIDESTGSLRQLARRPRWAKSMALLQTMPGLGLITGLTILAELGDLSRFHSRAAVANYAGLVPVVRDSDSKHYRGGITHRGSSHLRGMLTEAAWRAVPRVPVYQALFDRIQRRGGKAKAIVAVARRMLEDSWTMLQKDEPFRYVAPPRSTPEAETPGCDQSIASSVAG